MRTYIFILLISTLLLPACTTLRKVHKDKTIEEKELVSAQKTETHKNNVTNSNTQTISKTTIIEKADTNIIIPGSTLFGVKLLADIMAGNNLKVESENQLLEVFWDSLSNTIKAQAVDKERKVPIKFIRETKKEEFAVSNTQSHENTASTDSKQVEETTKNTHEVRDVEVKRTYWPFYLGGAIVLVVIIVVVVWGRKLFGRYIPWLK